MNSRLLCGIVAAHLALTALVYALLPEVAHVAGDAQGYLAPARQWLAGGGLDTSLRLPGYTLLLTGLLLLGPVAPLGVAVQAGLLLATGVVTQRMADELFGPDTKPGRFPWVLVLTLFNPAAVIMVQWLLPGTFFALLAAVHLLYLLRFSRGGKLRAALLAGLAAGLCGLVRPNGVHVLLLAPLALSAARLLAGKGRELSAATPSRPAWLRLVAGMVLMLAAGGAVLAPQLFHMHAATGQWRLYSADYARYAVHDNLVMLTARAEGLDNRAALALLHERTARLEGMPPEHFEALGWHDLHARVAAHAEELVAAYPLSTLIRAVAHGLGVYLLDGGTSLWLDSFRVPQLSARAALSALFRLDWGANRANLAAWLLPLGFVLAVRLAALPALVDVLRTRRPEWLLVLGYVVYFAAVAAFLGYARYRLPSEGLLFVLAVHGGGMIRRCLSSARPGGAA